MSPRHPLPRQGPPLPAGWSLVPGPRGEVLSPSWLTSCCPPSGPAPPRSSAGARSQEDTRWRCQAWEVKSSSSWHPQPPGWRPSGGLCCCGHFSGRLGPVRGQLPATVLSTGGRPWSRSGPALLPATSVPSREPLKRARPGQAGSSAQTVGVPTFLPAWKCGSPGGCRSTDQFQE